MPLLRHYLARFSANHLPIITKRVSLLANQHMVQKAG
jgi:hypothetical protein